VISRSRREAGEELDSCRQERDIRPPRPLLSILDASQIRDRRGHMNGEGIHGRSAERADGGG